MEKNNSHMNESGRDEKSGMKSGSSMNNTTGSDSSMHRNDNSGMHSGSSTGSSYRDQSSMGSSS